MKKIEITCDACGKDLTETGNCVDYRLALINENIQSVGGFVTSAMRYPAIKHNAHFCGMKCLKQWVDEGIK